jgi:hypothetical protein
MKRNLIVLVCALLLSGITLSRVGQAEEDKKAEWKALQLKCLTAPAPKGGGLTAAEGATAQAAFEACRKEAKEAGKDGWKEAFEKCISSQPANIQAAGKKCHPPMHGHKGHPPEGEQD